MNVYEMEGFLRGKCIPRDILVNESVAAYLVRKLNSAATMKAERDAQQKRADALAVENAALKLSRETLAKNALETCNDVFSAGYHSPALHRGLMESTGNRNTYPNPISALVNEAVRELETPATDAALAAIQAQGVEKFAVQQEQLAADYRKLSPGCYGEISSAENALMARDFAANLREAK